MLALNITDSNRKRALMLHLAGERVYEIFQGLVLEAIPNDADAAVTNAYTVATKALNDYFNPKRNQVFEIYNFRLAKQRADETMDSYHTRLRILSKYCEFGNLDAELKNHIIQTCVSTRLRRKALSEPDMTLPDLLNAARAMEIAERQVKSIEAGTAPTLAAVRSDRRSSQPPPPRRGKSVTNPGMTSQLCRNCGKAYPHAGGREACPAFGKVCFKCNKPNHWSKCCRSTTQQNSQQTHRQNYRRPPQPPPSSQSTRQSGRTNHVRQVRDDVVEAAENCVDVAAADSDEYAFTVESASQQKQTNVSVRINGTPLTCILDTGASST
jgi:hypothetical protein